MKPSHRREMAQRAVKEFESSIRLACNAFSISEKCYLYLRNVKGFTWNHKRIYRIYRELEQIMEWRGRPKIIRCANGPEYVSSALRQWAEKRHIQLQFIQLGKPQQNAYIERYNRTVRYDWLAHHLFESVSEV